MARSNEKKREDMHEANHEEHGSEVSSEIMEPTAEVERNLEMEKLRAERDTLVDRLARMQADFENARKRASKEQQDFRDFALADAINSLLPVLDSFERALKTNTTETSEFRSGVELIYKQLQDSLAKLGLTSISAEGQAFDPRFHEAIEMVDTNEAADHAVLEELQRGYKLKERLLRPAMVRVARNPGK